MSGFTGHRNGEGIMRDYGLPDLSAPDALVRHVSESRAAHAVAPFNLAQSIRTEPSPKAVALRFHESMSHAVSRAGLEYARGNTIAWKAELSRVVALMDQATGTAAPSLWVSGLDPSLRVAERVARVLMDTASLSWPYTKGMTGFVNLPPGPNTLFLLFSNILACLDYKRNVQDPHTEQAIDALLFYCSVTGRGPQDEYPALATAARALNRHDVPTMDTLLLRLDEALQHKLSNYLARKAYTAYTLVPPGLVSFPLLDFLILARARSVKCPVLSFGDLDWA